MRRLQIIEMQFFYKFTHKAYTSLKHAVYRFTPVEQKLNLNFLTQGLGVYYEKKMSFLFPYMHFGNIVSSFLNMIHDDWEWFLTE